MGLGGTGKLRQQLRGRTLYLDCAEDVGGRFPGLDGNPGLSQEPAGKFGGEVVKYLKREKTMDTEAVEGGSGRAKVDELLARGQSLWLDTLSRALMESGEPPSWDGTLPSQQIPLLPAAPSSFIG